MRPKELKSLLKVHLARGSTPDKELGSIMIWGPPGIGKSRIVEDVAKEEGVKAIDFRLLLCDPSDLRGIPIPTKDNNGRDVARWLAPEELPRDGKGFLFFDDLPTAPPLVQGTAYQITIRPHQLGNYHLPEGIVIIAAGNRMQDRSLAHRMPAALANRFIHVDLEPDLDDWRAWCFKNFIRPEVISFVLWRPELLFQFHPDKEEHAFPTPRSWEMVSRLLAADVTSMEAIEGTVGKGAAAEFSAFLRLQTELPDIDSILDGKIAVVPSKIDLRYALVCALASRGKPRQYDNILDYSYKLPAEFAVLLISLITTKSKESATALCNCKGWPDWTRKYAKVVF